jgi:uncharacterized membrane protein (UPF0127 family)
MRNFSATLLMMLAAIAVPASGKPSGSLPHTMVVIETARGPVRFQVEVAGDEASQERGLMYRRSLAPDAGMLFDFHQPSMATFWMKNTRVPLDMIFIRSDATISTIHSNARPYSLTPIPSAEPIRAVLEIKGGRADALGMRPGDRVRSSIFDHR